MPPSEEAVVTVTTSTVEEKPKAPPPPPTPKADDEMTLKELREGQKKLEEKLAAGEIRGMSESTAHALLEELKRFRETIAAKQDEVKKGKGLFDGF